MFKIIENDDLLKAEFTKNTSIEDFKEAVLSLLKTYDKSKSYIYVEKFKVIFYEKAGIINRGKRREVKEIDLNFFTSFNRLCYRIDKRSGYSIDYMNWDKIQSIELWKRESKTVKKREEYEKEKFFKRVENRLFDDLTWSNLNKDSFDSSNGSFYYLKNVKFSSHERAIIENAFKEKKKIMLKEYGEKRHFTVETKMGEDGIFRAWFSSEYADCANGSYYLLLNPDVAVHYEYD